MEKIYKWEMTCATHGVVHNYSEDDTSGPGCPINNADSITGIQRIIGSLEKGQTKQEPYVPSGGANMVFLGFQLSFDTETSIKHRITKDFYPQNGSFEILSGHAKDKISMKIVDTDNLLGTGPNYVVAEHVFESNAGSDLKKTFPRHEPKKKTSLNLNGYDLEISLTKSPDLVGIRTVLIDMEGWDALE